MKITLLSVGSTGDVRPFILIGRALKSRGHSVTITAFSRFAETVTAAGLNFHALSGSVEKMMESIMEPDTSGVTYLPRLWKGVKDTAPEMLQDMLDSCRGADAMVCNFFGSVYYSIAEKYGIPCIQVNLFPMDPTGDVPISAVRNQRLGSFLNKSTYKAGYYLIGTIEKHVLGQWRRSSGLTDRRPAIRPDYRIGSHVVPVIYPISPCLFPRPEDWGEHVHMSGFCFDESPVVYDPPRELTGFLSAGEKPVYIGFGSMNSGDMNRLLSIVLRSVHAAGIRAVISAGWHGRKLKSGRSVIFVDDVPHDWLFPRVSAVVHHGGAGTTAAGLRYGKPALVIPFAGDQTFWGTRVYRVGCGPKPVPRASLTVHRLTKALLDLKSNSSYYENARHISESLGREHGVLAAADLIEQEIARW